MQNSTTDAQLHSAVTRYAHENGVNYSEALQAVTDLAQADSARSGDAVQKGFLTGSDAAFHAEAVAYQHKHRVSYMEAAKAVAALKDAQPANFSEAVKRGRLRGDDAELHAKAIAYQYAHRVSYSDGLAAVSSSFAMAQPHSFAEATPQPLEGASDAALHAAATAYSLAHGIGYADALNIAASNAGASFAEAVSGQGAKTAIEGQEIEIFKADNQVDNEGRARAFPVAVVVAMAAAYSPARHEAPLTLGHPADNLPAYGWAKSLRATADGRLMMRAGDVVPEFSEAVKAGRYKKRSASFYPPNAPNNPVPGSWYLRHVAWLGAQVPAVKGLADVQFGAQENEDSPCFEF